jgi:hypothetical protein
MLTNSVAGRVQIGSLPEHGYYLNLAHRLGYLRDAQASNLNA